MKLETPSIIQTDSNQFRVHVCVLLELLIKTNAPIIKLKIIAYEQGHLMTHLFYSL